VNSNFFLHPREITLLPFSFLVFCLSTFCWFSKITTSDRDIFVFSYFLRFPYYYFALVYPPVGPGWLKNWLDILVFQLKLPIYHLSFQKSCVFKEYFGLFTPSVFTILPLFVFIQIRYFIGFVDISSSFLLLPATSSFFFDGC
jgi:hypothetical protein